MTRATNKLQRRKKNPEAALVLSAIDNGHALQFFGLQDGMVPLAVTPMVRRTIDSASCPIVDALCVNNWAESLATV